MIFRHPPSAAAAEDVQRGEIPAARTVESSDADSRWVWLVAIGLLVVLWGIVLALYPFFTYFVWERAGRKPPRQVLEYIPAQPPSPRNESAPAEVTREIQARSLYALTHYQWVDHKKNVISIPIDRAIELLVERGVTPTPTASQSYYPPHAGTMRTGTEGKVDNNSQ